jgi:hypothetical protein
MSKKAKLATAILLILLTGVSVIYFGLAWTSPNPLTFHVDPVTRHERGYLELPIRLENGSWFPVWFETANVWDEKGRFALGDGQIGGLVLLKPGETFSASFHLHRDAEDWSSIEFISGKYWWSPFGAPTCNRLLHAFDSYLPEWATPPFLGDRWTQVAIPNERYGRSVISTKERE